MSNASLATVDFSSYPQNDGTFIVYACIHLGRDVFIGSSGSVARNEKEVDQACLAELRELQSLMSDMGYEAIEINNSGSSAKRAPLVAVTNFTIRVAYKTIAFAKHLKAAWCYVWQPLQDID